MTEYHILMSSVDCVKFFTKNTKGFSLDSTNYMNVDVVKLQVSESTYNELLNEFNRVCNQEGDDE